MVDTRDSKSRAKERGGSIPLQGIFNHIFQSIFLSELDLNSLNKSLFLSKNKS